MDTSAEFESSQRPAPHELAALSVIDDTAAAPIPLAHRPPDERLRVADDRSCDVSYSTRRYLALGGLLSIGLLAPLHIMLVCSSLVGLWFLRSVRQLNEETFRAIDLLNTGHPEAAEEIFLSLVHRSRPRSLARHVALNNVAYLKLRTQRYDEALAIASELHRSRIVPPSLRRASSGTMCQTYALLGHLDAAEACLRQGGADRSIPIPCNAAVTLARRGHFAEVCELLYRAPSAWQTRLWGHEMRIVALMRAYSWAGTTSDSPRAQRLANAALVKARPVFDGEYDYLTAPWPELRAFVDHQSWSDISQIVGTQVANARLLRRRSG